MEFKRMTPMSAKTRLFILLWGAGFIGIISFLLVDLSALIALVPTDDDLPRITPAVKLLSVVQPGIFLALAVMAGVSLAPKVGLSASLIEAWMARGRIMPALKPTLVAGILGGLGGGIAIVLIATLMTPFLPDEAVASISAFGKLVPFPTRLLYGGITEELLLRWGLMTLLVWGIWRVVKKQHPQAPSGCFHAAILASAVIFGVGHLPVVFLVVQDVTYPLIAFVIIANSAFGLVAGYLFWKRGLEAAILAHMKAHVVMFTASSLGLYY